jgi:hypothetical protein
MTTGNTRRQKGEPPIGGRNQDAIPAGGDGWLGQLAAELSGAIGDHRKWIDSDRARTLGTTFEVAGRLFTYGAYLALIYLAFNSFVDIRNGMAMGIYDVPEIEGSRAVLFRILAAGLVGPIVVIAVGIGVGWVYNLTVAAAYRVLPRFAGPLVHPSVMFAIVAVLGIYHSAVTSKIATGYLTAKATLEAASPAEVTPATDIPVPSHAVHNAADSGSPGERELARLKAIVNNRLPPAAVESSSHDLPDATGPAGRDSAGERELARLKEIFNNRRPCSKESPETGLKPSTATDSGNAEDAEAGEIKRPEPGPASSADCRAEKERRYD